MLCRHDAWLPAAAPPLAPRPDKVAASKPAPMRAATMTAHSFSGKPVVSCLAALGVSGRPILESRLFAGMHLAAYTGAPLCAGVVPA